MANQPIFHGMDKCQDYAGGGMTPVLAVDCAAAIPRINKCLYPASNLDAMLIRTATPGYTLRMEMKSCSGTSCPATPTPGIALTLPITSWRNSGTVETCEVKTFGSSPKDGTAACVTFDLHCEGTPSKVIDPVMIIRPPQWQQQPIGIFPWLIGALILVALLWLGQKRYKSRLRS